MHEIKKMSCYKQIFKITKYSDDRMSALPIEAYSFQPNYHLKLSHTEHVKVLRCHPANEIFLCEKISPESRVSMGLAPLLQPILP